jgi:hypothetical protein
VSVASASTIDVLTNPTSGGITEIHWNFSATDPASFNLLLMNSTEPFDLGLIAIIGKNLQTELNQITTQLPTVPAM